MNLSIIIFCYNEEYSIGAVIENTIQFLSRPSYQNSEIIIVNDGSTDNTRTIIDSFKGRHSNYIIKHIYPNQGIGNALNVGYDTASKDFICAIPGDNQFNIYEIDQIKGIKENEFVTFYRKKKNYNMYRGFLTSFNQWFNKLFLKLDVPDINWIKIYRLEHMDIKYRTLKSSLVESEICAKLIKIGNTHSDYPSTYLPRKYGKSKGGSFKTLKQALSEVIVLYREVRKFK